MSSLPYSAPILLFTLLLPLSAFAADMEEERWFQVELILFAHHKGTPLEAEQWPEITGLLLPETLHELNLPSKEPPAEGEEPQTNSQAAPETETPDLDAEPPADPARDGFPEMPVAFQLLGEQAFQLTETAEKIGRSSRYQTLLHIAWQQPTVDREHAQPIFFIQGMSEPMPEESALEEDQTGTKTITDPLMPVFASEEDTQIGPPNPQFVGTVTLSVERYLHLAVDLLYRQPVTQHLAIPVSDLELWYDRPYPTLSEPQGPAFQQESWHAVRGFRFVESRRMRSREIHYLDNPFMGMVVLITPVELPEPAEEIQQTAPQNILQAPRR